MLPNTTDPIPGTVPPPPRTLQPLAGWDASWLFGALGAVGTASTVLVLSLLAAAGMEVLPFDGLALDAGTGTAVVAGEVVAVEKTFVNDPRGKLRRVTYRFTPYRDPSAEGDPRTARTTLRPTPEALALRPGDTVRVRHLVSDPGRNRLEEYPPATPGLGMRVVLTCLMVLALGLPVWIRAVAVRRRVLREGLETSADVSSSRRIPLLNPPTLRLHLSFHDASGHRIEARTATAEASETGRRILDSTETARVRILYDPDVPERVCLARRHDFAT